VCGNLHDTDWFEWIDCWLAALYTVVVTLADVDMWWWNQSSTMSQTESSVVVTTDLVNSLHPSWLTPAAEVLDWRIRQQLHSKQLEYCQHTVQVDDSSNVQYDVVQTRQIKRKYVNAMPLKWHCCRPII
jgi:hypothetical protein